MGIEEKAKEYFQEHKYNCCQAVVCAYCDEYGINDREIFRLAESFGFGMGGLKDTCGAVTGMFMAIGLHSSAGEKENPRKTKTRTYEEVCKAADEFQKKCGSIYCRDLKEGKIVTCAQCVEIAAEYVKKYVANCE